MPTPAFSIFRGTRKYAARLCSLLSFVYSCFSAIYSFLADGCSFADIEFQFAYQFFQVIKMGTGWAMVTVIGNTGRQLYNYPVFVDVFLCFDLLDQVAQFTVQWTSAAPTTGQIERPVWLVW